MEPEFRFMYGDLNDDGKILSDDLVLMIRYMTYEEDALTELSPRRAMVVRKAGDLNADGMITARDLLMLKKYFVDDLTADDFGVH